MNKYDVIIIGAGPAGLSAAIYLGRAGKKTAVFEKLTAGGKLAVTPVIENYPGAVPSDGWSIAETMKKQAVDCGAQIISSEIESADLKSLTVTVSGGESFVADALILATGSRNGKLGLDGEDELSGRGISYCAVCDGSFFRGKDVMLAGGGERAVKDAKYLSGICRRVYFVTPNTVNADFGENVEVIDCALPVELFGNPLEKVTVKRLDKKTTYNVAALFVDTAQVAETSAFAGQLKTDEKGFIVTDNDMKTGIECVYAAGDVRSKTLRQVVTATSDGALAAIAAIKDISKKREKSKKI